MRVRAPSRTPLPTSFFRSAISCWMWNFSFSCRSGSEYYTLKSTTFSFSNPLCEDAGETEDENDDDHGLPKTHLTSAKSWRGWKSSYCKALPMNAKMKMSRARLDRFAKAVSVSASKMKLAEPTRHAPMEARVSAERQRQEKCAAAQKTVCLAMRERRARAAKAKSASGA